MDKNEVLNAMAGKLVQQQHIQNIKKEAQNQIAKSASPTYKPAQIKAINSDGTLNVQTKDSSTIMSNVVNRTLTDLDVGDWVLLLAPQGNFANAVASINWGSQPARVGYAGAYITADTGSGDAGLVCENTAGTSKTVINANAPFTVYKMDNGSWKQVGGITADGDFMCNKITNESHDTRFYAIIGINNDGYETFEIHRVELNKGGQDVVILEVYDSISDITVMKYYNDAFYLIDRDSKGKVIVTDDETAIRSGKQVGFYDDGDNINVTINKDGLGIINSNGYYHNFNTNPTTNALQTDGVDTWSGTAIINGLTITVTNGLITNVQ